MALLLLLLGAALVVAGAAVIYWPCGLIAAGVMLLVAGVDLALSEPAPKADP